MKGDGSGRTGEKGVGEGGGKQEKKGKVMQHCANYILQSKK